MGFGFKYLLVQRTNQIIPKGLTFELINSNSLYKLNCT